MPSLAVVLLHANLAAALPAPRVALPAVPSIPPRCGAAAADIAATEAAFARVAATRSVREAFVRFIADSGVVLVPGGAATRAQLAAAPADGSTLRWRPVHVEVSGDGELAVSTGPGEWSAGAARGAVEHSTFVTVWARQPGGTYRYLVDVGARHAAPLAGMPSVGGAGMTCPRPVAARRVSVEGTAAFAAREQAHADAARAAWRGTAGDYAADARVMRDGRYPTLGAAVRDSLAQWDGALETTTRAARAAGSGDLGYAWGRYVLRRAGAQPEQGNWLRVWRLEGREWRIAVEVLAADPAPRPVPLARIGLGITAATVGAHVTHLSSDALAGRMTPSPGLDSAAAYLARQFAAAGLVPAGDSGTWYQHYNLRDRRLVAARTRLAVRQGNAARDVARPGAGLFVLPVAADSVAAPIAVGGRATGPLTLPASVAGRFAVVTLSGDPMESTAQLGTAITAAIQAKAAGVILALDPDVTDAKITHFSEQLAMVAQQLPIPIAGVSATAARALLAAAGVPATALGGEPVVPGREDAVAVLHAPTETRIGRASNVLAMLPGRDPARRDSIVVITAHFDHVGIGAPTAHGDSIYNGADDNASGTAPLLEAARALAALPVRPARSVLFLAVSGEERGLLGSKLFLRRGTIPAARLVANLNMDMVGRNAGDELYALGTGYSTLGEAVRAAAADPGVGLRLRDDVSAASRWWGRSDHVSFIAAGVPALFLSSYEHPEYHTPADEAALIDTDKLARVARLVARTAHAVAEGADAPRWNGNGKEEALRAAQ